VRIDGGKSNGTAHYFAVSRRRHAVGLPRSYPRRRRAFEEISRAVATSDEKKKLIAFAKHDERPVRPEKDRRPTTMDRTHGREDRTHGRKDWPHGREDRTYGREDRTHGRNDWPHGREDRTHGRKDWPRGRNDWTHGREVRTHGREARKSPMNGVIE